MAKWLSKIGSNIYPLIDQLLVSGGNFLTVAISANLIPTPEQGKIGYVFAVYGAIVVINTTLIFQWASIKAPEEKNPDNYRSLLGGFQLLVAFPVSLILATIIAVLSAQTGWVFSLIDFALIFMYIFVQQLANYDRRLAYIFMNPKRAALSSALVYPARILLMFILKPDSAFQIILIMIITALIPAAITIFNHTANLIKQFNGQLVFARKQLLNTRWLLLSGPLDWLWANIPIFALGNLSGLASVGILTAVNSIANVGNLMMELLETEGAARMGRQYRDGYSGLKKVFVQFLLFGLALWFGGFILFLSFGDEILGLTVGNNYKDFGVLLVILWIGKLVYFLFHINAVRRRTMGATQIVPAGYLAGCFLLAMITIPLIRGYDNLGAALGYPLSGIAIIATQEWAYQKILIKEHYN